MTDPTIDKAALEALLPCPFCGYALPLDEGLCIAKVDEFGDEMEESEWRYTGICCASCAAYVVGDGYSRDEAIAAWNRRASPTTSPQAPEGVRDGVLDRDDLLAITEHLLMLADIDDPDPAEPDCTDLCGTRVCDQLGCVVSKWRRVRT